MNNSISGSATAPLPVRFVLNRYVPNEGSQRSDELARQRAAKRKAQHEVEMLALEWSKIMLEKTINAALDPTTDPALAAKLREQVLNRGVGKAREAEDEDANTRKKGGDPAGLLEVLAAFSTAAGVAQALGAAQTPRIERDIGSGGTDEDSLQSFLDDLSGDGEIDGE